MATALLFDVDGVLTDEHAQLDHPLVRKIAALSQTTTVAFITGRSRSWLKLHLIPSLLLSLGKIQVPAIRLAADRVRNENLARFRYGGNARGDIDRPSINVVAFTDNVAGMNSQVELELDRITQRAALQGTRNRVARRWEDGEDPVAHKLSVHRRPSVLAHKGAPRAT